MDLIDSAIKIQTKITKAEFDRDFWWKIFHDEGGEYPHEMLVQAEDQLNDLKQQYQQIEELYEKKISNNNNTLNYALTIGSSEKENHEPCMHLYNKFISSADCNDAQHMGYFEKGDNGYIHIHAIITKPTKFKRSINEMRKRHGTYKGKQHNWDLKRITGLEIPKWKNYIKKDSQQKWNSSVNLLLSGEDSTPQEVNE